MKIYYGKSKSKSKQITLKQLILKALEPHKTEEALPSVTKDIFTTEADRFSDNSASWINVEQCNHKIKKRISIFIGFDPETDNTIDEIDVYEADIKVVVDDDSEKKLT